MATISFFEELRNGDPKGKAVGMIETEDRTGVPNALVDLNGGMSMAAKGGSLALVQLMHRTMKARGVRIKSYNWAIDTAASVGAVSIVDWLMEQANADGVQLEFELPMWMAAWGGHLGLVKKFIGMGANKVNSALFQAAWNGKLHVIMYLILERNADAWDPALRLFKSPDVLRELWDHNSNLFVQHGLVRPPSACLRAGISSLPASAPSTSSSGAKSSATGGSSAQ